jgi:Na+-translocating ferredoxin:NAD+ oxidoreductase RNF subunit RnfB
MDFMNINTIIISMVSVTTVGIICALVLTLASKIMYVKVDERLILLEQCMPGANCGACGYPGCSAYAEALNMGKTKSNLCPPGGAELIKKISAVLGVKEEAIEKKIAIVYCNGENKSRQKKMNYIGVYSCLAVKQFFGGENSCEYGCLGYGDCQAVCPINVICMEDKLARIIKNRCKRFGLCVKACPNNLIIIENESLPIYTACKNTEKGAIARKKCKRGCIACKICIQNCPNEAITIENNLAMINTEKCNSCGFCAEVCVTKSIVMNQTKLKNHLPAVS